MLDTFEIVTTSGVVLWSRTYVPVGANVINSLIRDVFIEERTVDVHIRRLRLALQPTGHDRLIETVRGGGYRMLPKLPPQ